MIEDQNLESLGVINFMSPFSNDQQNYEIEAIN